MKQVNIIDCMESEELFKPLFKDLETWFAWMTFFKVLYGLKMSPDDYELFTRCTDRKTTSKQGFSESYAIVGSRGGKSYASAIIAVYTALFVDFSEFLARGEKAYVFCIATDKTQAKQVLSYIKGILELFPDMIKKDLTWEVELRNGVVISVKTCSYKAGRGFSTCCIVLDELAFYRDENSANPAEELIASLLPRLLPNGKLIGISTPYAKFGYLYQIYKDYFGNENDDVIVWKAGTRTMNPTFKDSLIQRFFRRDKAAARSEFNAEFREDITQFLTENDVDCAMGDCEFRYPVKGFEYKAFCDPSGGRLDSFTMAIGHQEKGVVVVDRVEEIKPPFDPETVVRDFCKILKSYRIWQVTSDRYAGEWVSSSFKRQGISLIASELDRSSIYLESQPLFSMKKIKLPRSDKLRTQLISLERKTRSGGRDIIDHPSGLHDDLSNSVCGVAVNVHKGIFQRATPEELSWRRPVFSGRSRPSHRNELSERRRLEREFVRQIRKEVEEEENNDSLHKETMQAND